MLINYRTLDKAVQSSIKGNSYSEAAKSLLKLQRADWSDLNVNYEKLNSLKTKTIWFDGFRVKLQYNPGRMKSTSAKVDKASIDKRDCFLCAENLPTNQYGIKIFENHILLCNPFPVFPEHFTIVFAEHKQQEILSSFYGFIEITKRLGNSFSLIYNGPGCGASAPDHLHFQAGTKGFMPIEDDYYSLLNEYGEILTDNDGIIICAVNDGLRNFIALESKDKDILFNAFSNIYNICSKSETSGEEPLLNIICNYYEERGWRLIVFIRTKHRSSHYYYEGESRVVFSPAAIDLGGLCITPVKKDFERLDKDLLVEIFTEIFPANEEFEYLKSSIVKKSG